MHKLKSSVSLDINNDKYKLKGRITLDFSLIIDESYKQLTTNKARLQYIQQKFKDLFPFENLDIIRRKNDLVTPQFLYEKLIENRRGGVCYELNGLLYLLLKELQFPVRLAAATVWSESGWSLDRTHTMILWENKEGLYVVDSGFSTNLPEQPVRIDGPSVTASAGTFRIRSEQTEKRDFSTRKARRWEVDKTVCFLPR